jgi:hypothetical protein
MAQKSRNQEHHHYLIGGLIMMNSLSNTLSENATLVRITAKHPSGIKVDREINAKTAEQYELSSERLLQTTKHIFGHDINKYFRRILNNFRNGFYYPLTVAWDDSSKSDDGYKVVGWRLCPNTNLEQLQKEVDAAKQEWEAEVKSFVKNYSDMLAAAKGNLGQAYKAEDYPSIDDLESKFVFEFEVSLIPQFSDDIRLNLSESLRKRIENDAVNRANKNIKNVLVTTVSALVEQVEHVSQKLGEYDPKNKSASFFNKSSFDKLRQAVDMLPTINSDILGGNKTIIDAHQKLVSVFATIDSIEALRGDSSDVDTKRKKIAGDLTGAVGGLKGGFLDKAFGGSKHD